ncbi:MAG TPA: FtsK/SpoIIIE domain-containing protein [Candidatus Dormibacteraeota bacterium]|nr:FtsK/SpoIIIE domain-containing protein [Candidatus Dormibacteraeota bacterium]
MSSEPRTRGLWICLRTASARRVVEVAIEPDRPAADLVDELARHVGLAPGAEVHSITRGRRLDASGDVAGLGLRMGEELWLLPAGRAPAFVPPPERAEAWELRVLGGPAAGLRVPLGTGEHVLGRGRDVDVRLPDPTVSRVHLRLRVEGDVVTVLDAGSRLGVHVDGRPVTERRLEREDVIEVGASLIAVRRRGTQAAPLPRDGRIPFNRPPSAGVTEFEAEVRLPAAPVRPQRLRLPIAAWLGPLLLGGALWLTSRSQLALLFALGTPLMAVMPVLEDWLLHRREGRREARRFRTGLAVARRELARLRAEELRHLRACFPDPCELEDRAWGVRPTLWERRRDAPGFLRLRLGWGDVPSRVRVEVPDGAAARAEEVAALTTSRGVLPAAPVTLDVAALGCVGLTGPARELAGLTRWLIVQAATLHGPGDLIVAAFPPAARSEEWAWMRWLPHARDQLGPGVPTVPATVGGQERLANALAELVAGRERAGGAASPDRRAALVVVHDDAAVDRTALAEVLRGGPGAGVHVLWTASDRRRLPEECRAVVEVAPAGGALTVRRFDGAGDESGVADLVGAEYAAGVARALSGVEDPGSREGAGAIPASVGLLECLGLLPDLEAALRRWWSAPPGDLMAPIGMGAGGVTTVDLREHGPHALVGGTSGAGKSELLRAWVGALAAWHSPRRLNFLLVDFKGGTALQECARLPHVVGLVTDLSEHLLRRVRHSLLAELERREAEMARHGEKEFVDFERRHPDRAFPVLVVVFDEFEQLRAEHPAFVEEVIVPIARLGRGLGVHLILGTQRPQGSVPEAIRSNTNIRIALRMLGSAQSRDVIDSPAAAHISPAARGRAFLRLSHHTLVALQVPYAGARSVPASAAPVVRDLRFADPDPGPATGEENGPTDFERLAGAMESVSARLGLPPPSRPWLPPPPPVLPLAELPEPEAVDGVAAPLGLVDEPRRQRQWTFVFQPARDGHLLVYGTPGSGKSTLLRTLACALSRRHGPDEVHLYGLDFSSGAMRCLEALPHVGGVAVAEDPERVVQLLRMLTGQVARRRAAPGAAADLPLILLLVDEYASFQAVFERIDGGRYLELLEGLIRDGRGCGVYCVLTTSQRRDLHGPLSASITRRLLLRPDRHDQEVLGLSRDLPAGLGLPPGRGLLDARLEIQVATMGDGAPGAELAAIASLGAELVSRYPTRFAPRLEVLPEDLSRSRLPPPGPGLRAVVGLGGDGVIPIEVDLADGHLLVCGPRGSGRTTALATIALSLARGAEPPALALLAPRRRSELASLVEWRWSALGDDECARLVDELGRAARAGLPGSTVLVVDDAELLAQGAIDGELRRLARLGREVPLRIVAAAETRSLRRYSEWLNELRDDRHALLLNPDPTCDGDLFGAGPLPRPLRPWPAGRGFLLEAGRSVPVQVAR